MHSQNKLIANSGRQMECFCLQRDEEKKNNKNWKTSANHIHVSCPINTHSKLSKKRQKGKQKMCCVHQESGMWLNTLNIERSKIEEKHALACKLSNKWVHTHISMNLFTIMNSTLNDVKNRKLSDEWVDGKHLECSHSYSSKIIADVKSCAAKRVSLW